MKCLIVDDDPRSREMTRRILGGHGHDFLEAADGGEALALYREHRPEVVIMDVEMAPIDGITATESICRENGDSRIVVVSNHGTEEMREASLRAGACHFIRKEELMSLQDIVARIEANLSPPESNES